MCFIHSPGLTPVYPCPTLQAADGGAPTPADVEAARKAQISSSAIPVLAACPGSSTQQQLQQLWPAAPDGVTVPLPALASLASSCPGSMPGDEDGSVGSILAALAPAPAPKEEQKPAAASSSSTSSTSSTSSSAAGSVPSATPVLPAASSMRRLLSDAREALITDEKELLVQVGGWTCWTC